MRTKPKRSVKVISSASNVLSELTYALVSNNMHESGIWHYPIADIGGFDFSHRYLFPSCKDWTLIDKWACDIDVSDLPKGTHMIISSSGFPRSNVKTPSKCVAIALYSLTIDDQYINPEVIKTLSEFSDVYITIPHDRPEAYNLYSDAFHGNLECVWTRELDHLKLMHYWNE